MNRALVLGFIDDKHVPMINILWVSNNPHFCGNEECDHEGMYQIYLGDGESLWVTQTERDKVVKQLESFYDQTPDSDEGEFWGEGQ